MEVAFRFPNVALKIKGAIVFHFETRCFHVIERLENSNAIDTHFSRIITGQIIVTVQPDAESRRGSVSHHCQHGGTTSYLFAHCTTSSDSCSNN
jgi:hypothetical protein